MSSYYSKYWAWEIASCSILQNNQNSFRTTIGDLSSHKFTQTWSLFCLNLNSCFGFYRTRSFFSSTISVVFKFTIWRFASYYCRFFFWCKNVLVNLVSGYRAVLFFFFWFQLCISLSFSGSWWYLLDSVDSRPLLFVFVFFFSSRSELFSFGPCVFK